MLLNKWLADDFDKRRIFLPVCSFEPFECKVVIAAIRIGLGNIKRTRVRPIAQSALLAPHPPRLDGRLPAGRPGGTSSFPFVGFLLHHSKRRFRLALCQQRLAEVVASPREVRLPARATFGTCASDVCESTCEVIGDSEVHIT